MADEVLSFEPKTMINSQAVAHTQFSYVVRRTPVNIRDSESGRNAARTTDEDQVIITATGLRRRTFSPHLAPFNLGRDETFSLQHWPRGNEAPNDTHILSGTFIVTEFAEDTQTPGGTNQTWRLTAESTGAFTLPGET